MLELVDASVLTMAPQYPELNDEVNRIRQIAVGEESAFLQTLRTGTTIFDTAVASVRSGGGSQLSGDEAFALHDTYGFPFDLTLEMASEQGLSVDEEGFRRLMQQQRERAKADSKARKSGMVATTAYRDILQAGGTTTFTGYTEAVSDSVVIGIVKDGETVPAARVGDHVEIVLDRSPFYAEAGGQLGDHGRLDELRRRGRRRLRRPDAGAGPVHPSRRGRRRRAGQRHRPSRASSTSRAARRSRAPTPRRT